MIRNQYYSILYNFLFPHFIRKQLLAELQFEYNFTRLVTIISIPLVAFVVNVALLKPNQTRSLRTKNGDRSSAELVQM